MFTRRGQRRKGDGSDSVAAPFVAPHAATIDPLFRLFGGLLLVGALTGGCSIRAAGADAKSSFIIDPCRQASAVCGHIMRPLDPMGRIPGLIPIGFVLFKHRDGGAQAAGTIVATEGGPGFPASGSSDGYLALFAPLMDRRDLLLIDNRGTGNSAPIDCRELQTMRVPTIAAIGACGRALGPAADYYGTPLVADDFAAVLDALSIARIDLYGDSYGTFTAQIFAQRHPDRIRSLILDGAFATHGESGYFQNTPAAIRRTVDLVCSRAPDCREVPGTPLDRLDRLLERLRRGAISGQAPGVAGDRVQATLDPAMIGTMLYDATYDPLVLRELDAAVRALLDADDVLPLLRLAAETSAHVDSRDATGDARKFSYGLAAAVGCMDYPQIYDMTKPPVRRRTERDAAFLSKQQSDPGLYDPLTIEEWATLPLDYGLLDLCLDWPVATPPYPPGHPVPDRAKFPAIPTLVLSGELDTATSPEDADMAAKDFPEARHLLLANSFHVDAIDDDNDCASAIARRFIVSLDPGETACIHGIPPVRLIPGFFRHAHDVHAAEPDRAGEGSAADLATAAATVETAADVLDRRWRSTESKGAGLRGGRFTTEETGGIVRYRLQDVHWTEDLGVSGTLEWNQASGDVEGELRAEAASGLDHGYRIRWNMKARDGRVSIASAAGGNGSTAPELRAWMPVP